MNRLTILAGAYTLDWLVGDPECLPHPVRVIGRSIQFAESRIRPLGSGRTYEVCAGAVVAFGAIGTTFLSGRAAVRSARRVHRHAGLLLDIWVASTCLATRNLIDEAAQVIQALERDDLPRARQRLARIVGRDTGQLDDKEVRRAVIETLAESLCDGIVAPLFYLTLGGSSLALAYKAVNTLDSMIGHRDVRYLYFGRVSARLDDAANWIPARVSALLIAGSAGLLCGKASLISAAQTWWRDQSRHNSPNAGHPESAMAGALRVRLGGPNCYEGEPIHAPILGREFEPPNPPKARVALRVVAAASVLGFGLSLLFSARITHE